MSNTASFRIIAAPWRSIAPAFLYSPLTAADEKIPLSMVRVNNKPQHLVFCWYFAHLLSKHRHLPVESRRRPCLARRRAVCFALKSGQISGPGPIRVPPSKVALHGPTHKAQNRCRIAHLLCELWTSGDRPPAQLPAAGNFSRRVVVAAGKSA
jgi:hypothetical protein